MSVAGAAGCLPCSRGWGHCHGTWISHRDGAECSEACDVPAEAHDVVVDCQEIDRACCEHLSR